MVLTEDEVKQAANKFLCARYYNSRITFNTSQLITKDNVQVYQLEGIITIASKGSLDRFIVSGSANKYELKVEIGAQDGAILKYEFR